MRNLRIWVLVAEPTGARIYSTRDRSISSLLAVSSLDDQVWDGHGEAALRAWFGTISPCYQQIGSVRSFASHLAAVLHEAARENGYDGLIIIADREVAPALDRALTPETAALLIGDIICDSYGQPVEAPEPLHERPH